MDSMAVDVPNMANMAEFSMVDLDTSNLDFHRNCMANGSLIKNNCLEKTHIYIYLPTLYMRSYNYTVIQLYHTSISGKSNGAFDIWLLVDLPF